MTRRATTRFIPALHRSHRAGSRRSARPPLARAGAIGPGWWRAATGAAHESPGGWDDRRKRVERGERVGRPARRRSWSAPAVAGLYMLQRLRGLGLSATVLETGDGRRRHVVLEPLSGRPLRHPDDRLHVLMGSRAGERLDVVGEVRHAARDPEVPAARRRPLRPAARHPLLDRRCTSAMWDDAASTWTITTSGGDRHPLPLVRDGDRVPVGAQGGRHRGHRPLPGRRLLHEPLAPRGRRPDRQARRRDRHRLVRHPVDPADGRSRRPSSSCSSGRRTSRSRPATVRRRRPSAWTRSPPTATATATAGKCSRGGVPLE